MAFEVERKFILNGTVMKNLLKLGAKLHKETNFTDTYYDTHDFKLTSVDHWLRRRNLLWQLKKPLAMNKQNPPSLNTSYQEIEEEDKIYESIHPYSRKLDCKRIISKSQKIP